jgi:NodT family efflux transporter outer membrane factor (OMF) lipoprotein
MSRCRAWGLLATGVVALGLAGCVVGPRYAPPSPPSPASAGFAASTSAIASSDQPPTDWWRLYNDPAIDQLVTEALAHNRSLQVAAANLAQARAALSLARVGQFPSTTLAAGSQYGVSSNAVFANNLENKPGAPSADNYYTLGLDASYELDLFGRVRRGLQAASADIQARQAAEDVVRVSVAGETTRAYLNACAYAQSLAVARQSLDLVTQTYQATQARAQFGAASDFDLARAREQVAQAQAVLPLDEGQRRTALFELAVLTGQPPEAISRAADACKAPPKLAAALPVGDIGGLFRRRPDVRQAERTLAADVARIGVATADLYPTITLGGSGGGGATTLSGLTSTRNLTYGIGPALSWSFPNTFAALAEIRQARAVASADYANFDATVLQALQDTETALAAYGGELDHNTALTEAKTQSQKAFQLAQTQYRLGSISYLDLLTAQADLVSTSAALAASDQTLASDQVTVFKALGGGWEQAPPVTAPPIVDGSTGRATAVK